MRNLLLLSTLAFLPGCAEDLPLIEIGDLQGVPIGGVLTASSSQAGSTLAQEKLAAAESPPAGDTAETASEPLAAKAKNLIAPPSTGTPDVLASTVTSLDELENGKTEEANDEDEEILLVGFDTLADFEYEVPTTEEVEKGTHKKGQIPEDVLSLDGKRIEIEGYMVPMEVEKGMVKSFVLSRSLAGCCFGDWPILNEWVDVVMKPGEGAEYVPYAPVLVVGRLTVSEAVDEYGVLSIYRMVAETVEDPW